MAARLTGALLASLALAACAGRSTLPQPSLPGEDPSGARYVQASGGSDRNDGSPSHPYRTIARCATSAAHGQTCYVRGGTYREVIRPNNGVTIRPYGSERVVVIATQRVLHWTRSSGSIYSAAVALNPSLPANQVFVGPAMKVVPEAQWPAPSSDPMHPHWGLEATGSSETTIADPHLPSGDLTGAIVNVWSGTDPWTHVAGLVTASTSGRITFKPDGDGCPYFCSMPGGFYYVTGARALLTAPGEWWYDAAAKRLYLWAPGSANPNSLDVEAKGYGLAIDLRGRSGVTIQGITTIGGGIATNANSHNDTLDGIVALNVSQVLRAPSNAYATYSAYPLESGIVLDGTHNTLENSTVAYSATNGVLLRGSGNTVTNSLIHDVDSIGDYSAGVTPITGGNAIEHTTIYNTGRSAINFNPLAGLDVGYNNLYNSMLLSADGASIYACCMTQASATRLHDNWLHPAISPKGRLPKTNTCHCPWGGIYIDNGMGGVTIDHNVVWESYVGLYLHGQAHYPSDNVHIDNNTVERRDETPIALQNLAGYAGTEVSNNRIETPVTTDATSTHVPQTDNGRTAPGAGAIGRAGCSFAGCT